MRGLRLPGLLLLAAWLVACGGRRGAEPVESGVRLSLEARHVPSGQPLVVDARITEAEGERVELEPPSAEGLQTELAGEEEQELPGGHLLLRRYELSGPDGSYVITAHARVEGGEAPAGGAASGEAAGAGKGEAAGGEESGGPRELTVPPLFGDIGVQGPSAELEEIRGPAWERPGRFPWAWLGAGLGLLLLAGGGAWWLLRRRPALPAAPPPPPDLLAEREWRAVMEAELDEHERALRLSEVFRRYLEARYGWPATAMTTREVLDRLYEDGLPAQLLDRARRMLTPLDLLKFARKGGGPALFRQLDEDFRVFLEATRPEPLPEPGEGVQRA